MALIYQAELRPTKLELVSGWAPSQPWFAGDASTAPHSVGAYRFDDPEGEVGVETLLVRHGDGPTLQLPLTYRGVPLPDADEWLIGTMQHSVLGTRWVYDGAGDPVYLQTLASVIVGVGAQAELYVDVDGQQMKREPTAKVSGSGMQGAPAPALPAVGQVTTRDEGSSTVVEMPGMRVTIPRVLDGTQRSDDPAAGVLSGTWTEQPEQQPLAFFTLR